MKKNVIIVFLLLTTFASLVIAYTEHNRAEELRLIALEAKILAETNATKVIELEQLASQNQAEALRQRAIAEMNLMEAQRQTQIAMQKSKK